MDTTTIALLIGTFMPILISIVKQIGLSKWWNLVIAVVSCVIAGVVTVWARGELQWANAAAAILAVFVAAQAIYASFWRDSFDNAINAATSLVK